MTARGLSQAVGRLLVVAGIAMLSWSGVVWGRAEYDEIVRMQELPTTTSTRRAPTIERGQTLGLLEVPRLGLSTVVAEGDESDSSLVAAWHLPETPLPWHDGNTVLAGHRDMAFRPLKNIKQGDVIRFQTADGVIEYVVRKTMIVGPTDVGVLQPTERPILTLITCYPFSYIGSAPKRFVVQAERTGGVRAML